MEDIILIIVLLLFFGGPIITVLGWILGIIMVIWEFICEMFEGIGDFFRRRKQKKLEKKRKKEQQRREKLRKKHFGFASIDDVPKEKLLLEEMYNDHVDSDEMRATQLAKAAADLGSISCAYHAGRLLLQQGNVDEAERYAKMAEGKYDSTDQLLFRIRRAKLVRDGITAYDVGSWQEALDKLKQAMEMDFDPDDEAVERSECYYYAAAAAAKLAETVAQWEKIWAWACEADEAGEDAPFHERIEALKLEIVECGGEDLSEAMNQLGEGMEALRNKDFDDALASFLFAAQLGSHRAYYYVAFTYYVQGESVNMGEAMRWANKSKQAGDKEADELIVKIQDKQSLFRAVEMAKNGKNKEALALLDTLIDKGMVEAALRAAQISYDLAESVAGWEKNIAYLRKAQELGADADKVRSLINDAQAKIHLHKAVDLIYDESGSYNLKDVLSHLDKATDLGHSFAPVLAAKTLCETVINRTKNKRYEYETYKLCRDRLDDAANRIRVAKKMSANLEAVQEAIDLFNRAESALHDYKGF